MSLIGRTRPRRAISILRVSGVVVSTIQDSRQAASRTGAPRRQDHRATEAAARLMSETAHDLRAPLTTIRESVRIVRDGDLGDVTPGQQICLDSAIDQCDCMEQMIGEMVQVERLRTGTPRIQRRWVSIVDVRKAITETLRPWVLPREIDVVWDGVDEPAVMIFADPSMIRRLIVNLVTNALRVTRQGGQVMIRAKRLDDRQTLRWSVIDTGNGLNQEELEQIAERQVSFSGGEGLGLSICRQLAAVHFSKLSVQSRIGIGTEVSFESAAAGPRSVAELWSRWRVDQLIASNHRPTQATWLNQPQSEAGSNRSVRLDPPSYRVELAHEAVRPRCPKACAAGTVSLGATVNRDAADGFDKLLQSRCFLFDFVYRVETRRWVWVMDTPRESVDERIESINTAAVASSSNLRLRWSDAQIIPIDSHRTVTRLSDLLVRETLFAATSDRIADNNEVRLGTQPIKPSNVAADRLDEELARLSAQMKSQTGKLKQQAKNLRY